MSTVSLMNLPEIIIRSSSKHLKPLCPANTLLALARGKFERECHPYRTAHRITVIYRKENEQMIGRLGE